MRLNTVLASPNTRIRLRFFIFVLALAACSCEKSDRHYARNRTLVRLDSIRTSAERLPPETLREVKSLDDLLQAMVQRDMIPQRAADEWRSDLGGKDFEFERVATNGDVTIHVKCASRFADSPHELAISIIVSKKSGVEKVVTRKSWTGPIGE